MEVIKTELGSYTTAVSRDLRSLLRWISGFGQALERASAQQLDFRGRLYLGQLRRIIRQTGELAEALLEHAHLARAPMQWQEIDLSGQARTIAQVLQGNAPGRRVEFIIGTNLRAEGDPAMLRCLLLNLLGNAWNFTETVPRAKIEFGALPVTEGTRGFLVRDNRSGLAPNRSHGWFRAFHRLHATRDFSSPGPGLATVKLIIQRHGGRVWAGIDLRPGATFYFTLPPPGRGSAAETSGGNQPDSLTGSP